MIYFKCSQCGEKMEAPKSLRGQLLKCPKCGLHQTVKKSGLSKPVIIVIVVVLTLLISFPFVSEYYYNKGLKNGRDLGLEIGIKRGIKAQQLAFKIALSRLEERETTNKAILMQNSTTKQNPLREQNSETYISEQSHPRDISHIGSGVFRELPLTDIFGQSDYKNSHKLLEEWDKRRAEELGLTLEEYNALGRIWESGNVPFESREFSPERLAFNNSIRRLFDSSQGNKPKRGSDAYLTRKEIKGRQQLLMKRKRVARLQLKKEYLEKNNQTEEAKKLGKKIQKILSDN